MGGTVQRRVSYRSDRTRHRRGERRPPSRDLTPRQVQSFQEASFDLRDAMRRLKKMGVSKNDIATMCAMVLKEMR